MSLVILFLAHFYWHLPVPWWAWAGAVISVFLSSDPTVTVKHKRSHEDGN